MEGENQKNEKSIVLSVISNRFGNRASYVRIEKKEMGTRKKGKIRHSEKIAYHQEKGRGDGGSRIERVRECVADGTDVCFFCLGHRPAAWPRSNAGIAPSKIPEDRHRPQHQCLFVPCAV